MEFNATFIASAISFILFTIIMNAIFYKPLSNIVSERQKFVDDHYKDAHQARDKSKALLIDKEQKLEKSKLNAKKIILDKTEDVKAQKNVLTTEAQQTAQQTIGVAKGEFEKSKVDAQETLSNRVVDLAQNISSKILGENIAIQGVDSEHVSKIMQEG